MPRCGSRSAVPSERLPGKTAERALTRQAGAHPRKRYRVTSVVSTTKPTPIAHWVANWRLLT